MIRNSPYVASVESSTKIFAKVISDITVNYNLKEILDMGTGNGYIAIILAKEGKIVDASDISDEALKLASENAVVAQAQINFILSDLFENIHNKYDLICFNPPCGEAGKIGILIRNILKEMPYFEILTLSMGYFFFKAFRVKLIARFLDQCRQNLKKDKGLIVLKLINMEILSMTELFKKNRFEIIDKYPVTRMTKAIVIRSAK